MLSDGGGDYIDQLFNAVYDEDLLRFQKTLRKKPKKGPSPSRPARSAHSPTRMRARQSPTRAAAAAGGGGEGGGGGKPTKNGAVAERPQSASSKFVSKFRQIDVQQDMTELLRRSTGSIVTGGINDDMVPKKSRPPTYNNYVASPAVSYHVDNIVEKLPPLDSSHYAAPPPGSGSTVRWTDDTRGGRGGADIDTPYRHLLAQDASNNRYSQVPETPYADSSRGARMNNNFMRSKGEYDDGDYDDDAYRGTAMRVETMTRSQSHQVSAEGLLHEIGDCIQVRKNYLDQLLALENYERLSGVSQTLKDISLPNFYALLVSTRNISLRIARTYKTLTTKHAIDPSDPDITVLRRYIGAMASDLSPLDRQPFTDWTGLHFDLNPFICAYRIDGALASVFSDSPEHEVRGHAAMIAKELYLDQMQLTECRELGATILGSYGDIQRQLRIKSMEADMERQKSERSEKNAVVMQELEFRVPDIERQHALSFGFRAWRRAYDLQLTMNSMRYTRECFAKIKIFMALQRNVWVCKEFRRILQRRSKELVSVVLGAWVQYTNWCRRFNRILHTAHMWRKRYCFERLRYLSKVSFAARDFKRNRQMMPLVSGFRAFKWNLEINKFQRRQRLVTGSLLSMGDLNLRRFMFSKWIHITKVARVLEKTHVVSTLYHKRAAFRHWRSMTLGQGLGDTIRTVFAAAATSSPGPNAPATPTRARGGSDFNGDDDINAESFNSFTFEAYDNDGPRTPYANSSVNSKSGGTTPHITHSLSAISEGGRSSLSNSSHNRSWSSKLVRMFSNAT